MREVPPSSSLLARLFVDHPRDIGEGYAEHATHALWIGARMILSGFACLVHALVPGLFVRTASRTVEDIVELTDRRARGVAQGDELLRGGTMMEKPSN